jgi:CO/xanthine dehydrogenase FAD-binding subunit
VDLNTVAEVISPAAAGQWRPGDAWLGGGTALFAEPRPHLSRLLDLTAAGWPALTRREDGLEIAATCTIAELAAAGYDIVEKCCHAFLASFKIWNVATVGGNLCSALPAGPMIALGAALGGTCLILGPAESRREVPVSEFVTGEGTTVLRDGELLRSVHLPGLSLLSETAYRQASLHAHGRSGVLVIGRRAGQGLHITVTAATQRPYVLTFPELPAPEVVQIALSERVPEDAYVRDVHGLPSWRRHMTRLYAEEVRRELAG